MKRRGDSILDSRVDEGMMAEGFFGGCGGGYGGAMKNLE